MSALLAFLAGPLLSALVGLMERRLSAKERQGELAAELAAQEIRAEIAARAEARKVLIAEQGTLLSAGRIGRLVFVLPLGVWWTAVIADSIFGFAWNVSALPAPLDEWAGGIVLSLFLVDGAKGIARNLRGGKAG
ncbi:hypothetical protein [Stappia indica]|uniref:Holin of 3TMs, for gene-transfer release n=1 Tax=Stappia indica TaxID=538381 RepID=A0A857CCL8_9HYPH|nr:hypothetical protein [Stappia indica]QGZ36813.1 hypothetical protein GH266_21365 [Stappia indica]